MKKLFVILTLLLLANVFVGCRSENYKFNSLNPGNNGKEMNTGDMISPEKLKEEYEVRIIQSLLNRSQAMYYDSSSGTQEINIVTYLGYYRGSIAVVLKDNETKNWSSYFVEDFSISFENYIINIWKEDNIYSLNKAYDGGLINYENLESILFKAKEIGLISSHKVKKANCNDELDFNTARLIKNSYVQQHRVIPSEREFVKIVHYFGTYDDAVIINIQNMTGEKPSGAQYAGGYYFALKTNGIDLWFDNKLFSLGNAYELGYISFENLSRVLFFAQKKDLIYIYKGKEEVQLTNLDDNLELGIKQAYVNWYNKLSTYNKLDINKIELLYNLGTYGDSHAIVLKNAGSTSWWAEKVEGFSFTYLSEYIRIYDNEEIYSMGISEAFEKGCIDYEGLTNLLFLAEEINILYMFKYEIHELDLPQN